MRVALLLSVALPASASAEADTGKWQAQIEADGSQVTRLSAGNAVESLDELEKKHFGVKSFLGQPAPCGTGNPCQLCEDNPEAVCSMTPKKDGSTMCMPLCGASDPEKVMRSVRMDDDKACLHDLDTDLLRQLYVKVCPNAKRTGTANATSCMLNVGSIAQSNQTDEHGVRRRSVTVESGGMLVPKCGHGFRPTVPKLTCALGALFPATYECVPIECQAPNSSVVPNIFEGSGCLEGNSVNHGEFCTPRCQSGYRAAWLSDAVDVENLPEGSSCDWPRRPSPTSLCCSSGVLMPARFKCEPYMTVSDTLSTLAVKTIFNMASEIVPDGMTVRKIEHMKTVDIEKLFIVKTDRGVAVDFRNTDGYWEMLTNMSDPLPNATQGLGKFAVNISGQLEVDWLNDTVRCFPDRLTCKIKTLAFMHAGHDKFSNVSAMKAEDMNLTTKSERFDWMDSYEDACGFNLCGKIYELSVGFEKRSTGFKKPGVRPDTISTYQCDGTDPSYALFLPTAVLTTITTLFYFFSGSLLLQPWKEQWKAQRRVERLKPGQGAAGESQGEESAASSTS